MSADALDTNIFVYLFDRIDHRKRGIADTLVADAVSGTSTSISFQVVQETLSVVGGKMASPLTPEDARRSSRACSLPCGT